MSVKKPNFFIVGQTRSGTTSFQDELDQHPDIYFLKPEWPKGKGHFGWVSDYKDDDEYLEQFADVNNEKRIGERCNAYLHYHSPGCNRNTETTVSASPLSPQILQHCIQGLDNNHHWMYNHLDYFHRKYFHIP